MEGEDTYGQQTLQASCSAREMGSSLQRSCHGSTILPLKGWAGAWAKGKLIRVKQRFRMHSKGAPCCCAEQGLAAPWGCSGVVGVSPPGASAGPGVLVLPWAGPIASAPWIRSQQLEAGAGSLFRVKKH